MLRAVETVHAMIDREVSGGTSPADVFVFGLSQGGLTRKKYPSIGTSLSLKW